MRRVLLFVGAFGVLLVRCRCFLVTLLNLVVAYTMNIILNNYYSVHITNSSFRYIHFRIATSPFVTTVSCLFFYLA
jgi:hypothetical protein